MRAHKLRGLRKLPALLALCVTAFTLACGSEHTESRELSDAYAGNAAAAAPADTDDFGVALPQDARHATRVVSLNPAATEAIFAMGADSLLVGRSRWDEFPPGVSRIKAVGDGIRPNVEAVLAVRPTLVILYATPDNRSAAEAFRRAGAQTMTLRVDHIADFYRLVQQLGVALGAEKRAAEVSDSVRFTIERVKRLTDALVDRPTVVWPAWESPPMVIGGGSYLDELLTVAGARNVFHDDANPSPSVSIEEVARRAPDMVLASAAGAASIRRSQIWRAVPAVRLGHVLAVNDTLTGRPSVVLGMAAMHLARLLHPELADSLR